MNGWGENLAALDTVINTSGGSWFNPSWRPQLTSTADAAATKFYVNLVRKYGEPGASNDGFTECESSYGQGKAAMWYDATVGAGLISTSYPKISANTGYAYAPTGSPTGAPGVPSASGEDEDLAESLDDVDRSQQQTQLDIAKSVLPFTVRHRWVADPSARVGDPGRVRGNPGVTPGHPGGMDRAEAACPRAVARSAQVTAKGEQWQRSTSTR